jgi:hypothetical protein
LRYVRFDCDQLLDEFFEDTYMPFTLQIGIKDEIDPLFTTQMEINSDKLVENIIKGEKVQQISHSIGPYSVIIRTHLNTQMNYSYIVFSYNNDDLGVY